ncbi:hypothetical protein AKO1_006641 [Acrasis kona]|uniref:Nucleotidyltransferase n=1 Tax=Acrasis kona TaxID=1008807 RepID=A0AAW2YIN2_9EUKA
MMFVHEYLCALAEECKCILDQNFLGVYAVGSYSMDGYEHGKSDVDVLVVCKEKLSLPVKQTLVRNLSHDTIPCPAQKLELVVYAREGLSQGYFEINFNSGSTSKEHVCFDYTLEQPHWFVIDREIARHHAKVIIGVDPKELLTPVPKHTLVEALLMCLEWHRENRKIAGDRNYFGNAARALYWTRNNTWITKSKATKWYKENYNDQDRVMDIAIEEVKKCL